MQRGPRIKYCYICQKNGPCTRQAACHKLAGAERAAAYQRGYALKNANRLATYQARAYKIRASNPGYRSMATRKAESAAKKSDRRARKAAEREAD